MGFRKLQLNLLSDSGQLLNCINCFAGQVSVLRAASYNALQIYQRALVGIPGKERVAILLDGQPFNPSAHIFIGFGEQMMSSGETVIHSFTELGFTVETTVPFLRSYGVELTPRTLWSGLTKCEERRVTLLLAMQQPDRVLVLNDPFEPLAQQWRERFAELLVNFTRTKNQLVLVTSLSFRPESWIDNPVISRIQVGEEIQRTIGYGTAPSEAHQVLTQVRASLKDDAEVQRAISGSALQPGALAAQHPAEESEDYDSDGISAQREDETGATMFAPAFAAIGLLIPSVRKFPAPQRAAIVYAVVSRPTVSAGMALGIILGGLSSLAIMRGNEDLPDTRIAAVIENPPLPAELEPPHAEPPAPPLVPAPNPESAALNTAPEAPPPADAALVLDEYTAAVKRSIINSYRRESSAGQPQAADPSEESVGAVGTKSRETGELLQLLEGASGSGDKLPDGPVYAAQDPAPIDNYAFRGPPSQPEYQNEEEKREAIRKKFLEAIERAQEMRRNQAQ